MQGLELPSEWTVSKRQQPQPPPQGAGGQAKAATADADEDGAAAAGAKKRARHGGGSGMGPTPGPLGPRSTFDAATHDAPERGQVLDMVLSSLRKEPLSAAAAEAEEEIEVDCLLCKLPYKKLLSDLFGAGGGGGGGASEVIKRPQIPYVTRAYEESFMREPIHAGERKCAKGKYCECMFIDPDQPFEGVEFLLPGERQPPTPHMCVLCCRAVTQQLYYDVVFDKQVLSQSLCPRRMSAIAVALLQHHISAYSRAAHTLMATKEPTPAVAPAANTPLNACMASCSLMIRVIPSVGVGVPWPNNSGTPEKPLFTAGIQRRHPALREHPQPAGGVRAECHADRGRQRAGAHHAAAHRLAPAQPLHHLPAGRRQVPQAVAGVFSKHPFLLSVLWDVSPLYAHWRHKPVVSVRKGCAAPKGLSPPSSSSSSSTSSSSSPPSAAAAQGGPLFCAHSQRIEDVLRPLHIKLRAGERQYQAEIDRYLVVVAAPAFEHLVFSRSSAPHYDNLPDLSYYAQGILDPSKDATAGDAQQIFLMLRQCTPLRRRTKRAQRELQWQPESMQGMQVMVRCMQGTLLGLYPSCARPVAFGTRVEVYRVLRSMLVSDFKTLNACLTQLRYTAKVCIMEHLCNSITDYHPGLCHMLNKAGQQMLHFANAVGTMCDIFRSELNQLHATHGTLIKALPHLEKSAHSFFERCTRAYRGIITNQGAAVGSAEFMRKNPLKPDMAFVRALDGIYACR